MWQSHKRQAPIAAALGGACLFGLGLAGCARETGLDLAKQDARTDSSITERANESILRSRKELASTAGKYGSSSELAESDVDDKPSLASRWTAPFKGAGGLLKRKSDEPQDDPFLAESKDSSKDEAQGSIAASSKGGTSQKSAGDLAARKPAETQVAMASGMKPETSAPGARPKSATSSESQAALDDFLKSQEPVGVKDRALAASYESDTWTRKPGTTSGSPATSKTGNSMPATAAVETDRSEFADLAEKRVGIASTGKARPFPTEMVGDLDEAEDSPSAPARRPVAQRTAKNPLAASPAGVRRNPLIEEPEKEAEQEVASAPQSKLATAREIAVLLNKAKAAGEQGEFDEAKSYALAAGDLAEQCSYEFTSRESTPEKVVKWIESRQTASEQPSRPTPQRRAIAATRRPQRELAATTTAFTKPSAEQVFADEIEEASAAAEPAAGDHERPVASKASSFNQWAAGVGTEPVTRGPSPEWPVLSSRELVASNDLWQPSRSEFEQSLTRLREKPAASRTSRPAETRLAAAESDAPIFVATAEAQGSRHVASATRTNDPLVQLGQPTDLAPEAEVANTRSSVRRGPRLATPPPLSIERAGEPKAVAKVRSPKTSRTVWFVIVGGLAAATLVLFRWWAYRTPAAERSP